MKQGKWMSILLLALFLVGCGTNGPSNVEAEEVIYGVYFKEARIIEKRACELTVQMEADGYTNVWLVRYEFDLGSEGVMLLAETDSEEYPWLPYMTMAGASSNLILESCP